MDSAFVNIISWIRWEAAKGQTVGHAEKCNSREQRCFPTTKTSALFGQIRTDYWGSRQTRYREPVRFGGPIIIEKLLNINLFGSLDLLRPR